MSKLAMHNSFYRKNDSLAKSKSFATTSISSIYHLNSQSPTLEEILLNEAVEATKSTIQEIVAENKLQAASAKPIAKFGFSPIARAKASTVEKNDEDSFKSYSKPVPDKFGFSHSQKTPV